MNALYVTVSIPLLLVLAGFNHAHGLTTFGKSSNNNQQNAPIQPSVQRPCKSQANCTVIKGTTCIEGKCLCGDNTNPVNGACKAQIKGPRHLCSTDTDCVDNADCLPQKDKQNKIDPNGDKVCTCQEGFAEMGYQCSGSATLPTYPGMAFLGLLLLYRSFDWCNFLKAAL
ncbi:uncharacterized protein LOC123322435 [Coccinella septempunctata]|uniref:uncharacterized protein LOC123322435 n=1 Tax=Coccinella septempunctata TaxID=41139 RepID=UPI001D0969BB|nr:uncharacterized protein LOC123322435 [Coccinella septempunctata]